MLRYHHYVQGLKMSNVYNVLYNVLYNVTYSIYYICCYVICYRIRKMKRIPLRRKPKRHLNEAPSATFAGSASAGIRAGARRARHTKDM